VVWVLIAAALVSVALGELVDGTAIIAIVVLNALILRHCEICCDPGTSAYG
jgi:hypothetical protein